MSVTHLAQHAAPVAPRSHDEVLGATADATRSIAAVAHDLRSPLTSIVGYAEMLLDGEAGQLNAHQASMLSVMERNARRLLAITETLLAKATPVDPDAAIDVRGMITEIEQTLAPVARTQGVFVTTMVDHLVASIPGDQLQIDRVVMNVIANAIKFTPTGGHVTITAKLEPGAVRISCVDTGVGIPLEQQHQVFEPFFRAGDPSTKAATEGSGLGLSIAKQIVEAHQGKMDFESEQGTGTTVSIVLPIG